MKSTYVPKHMRKVEPGRGGKPKQRKTRPPRGGSVTPDAPKPDVPNMEDVPAVDGAVVVPNTADVSHRPGSRMVPNVPEIDFSSDDTVAMDTPIVDGWPDIPDALDVADAAPELDVPTTDEVSDSSQESEEDASAKVGRSAAMMSVLVIVSRITGFFRTWGQAMALGVTVTSSCYTVANNLPNQLYELVMGGMLATAFLPVYLSVKEKKGREGSNRYASNLLSIVFTLMLALAALGIVFAAQVVWTQSFGATSEFDFDLAAYFFRFFAIEVVLYACSAIISGVLNAERDYLWSNAAPIFNNFVCTASFFIYAALVNTNPTLAILCLALGNPLGVAIQVVMQLPSLKKHGIKLRPHFDLRDPALRETLSIGIPSLVVTIVAFVTVSVQTSSALSVTPAGSSIAYYTRLWYTLPYSILAIPITTAMFTELSDLISKNDNNGFVRGVTSGASQILFFLVPFMMYLIAFSGPLITLLAAGRFSPDEIAITASYLRALALSLPLYGVCTYLQKACSALRHMYLYAIANVIGGIVQVALCLGLTQTVGLNMVPLSSVAIFAIVDIAVLLHLRKQFGRVGISLLIGAFLRSLALGAVGAAAGFGIFTLLSHTVGEIGSSAFMAIAYLAASGIPAVLITFGLSVILKVPESSIVRSLTGRLLHRGK